MPTPNPTPSATPPSTSSGSGKKILIIVIVVVLGLGLLSMIASFVVAGVVGFGIKKAIETGTGIKIDENGGKLTLSGKDGESLKITNEGTLTFTDNEGNTATINSETDTLPANFTKDFPIHGSMTAAGGSVMQTPQGDLHTANWLSTASVPELDTWYRSQLPLKGWEVNAEIGGNTEQGSIISFTRGEGDAQEDGQLTILIDDSGKTAVQVLLTIKN